MGLDSEGGIEAAVEGDMLSAFISLGNITSCRLLARREGKSNVHTL